RERARDRGSGSYRRIRQGSNREIRREVRTCIGCGCRRAQENEDECEIAGHENLLMLFPLRSRHTLAEVVPMSRGIVIYPEGVLFGVHAIVLSNVPVRCPIRLLAPNAR